LETGHRFTECSNRASGKLAAKCGKCNKYPHPAAFCGIKTTPATSAPVAEETRTESTAVNSLGNWNIVNDVDEDATESINSVNLSCLFQPASVYGHIGNYYSKIILDTGVSLSVIKTDVAKRLFSEWKSKCELYTGKSIVTAAGHTLNTHGWLTFPVKIGNCTLQVKAIVADNLPHPILLGNDTIHSSRTCCYNLDHIPEN
jgi:hypothetical protein